MFRHLLAVAVITAASCAAIAASRDDTRDIARVIDIFENAIATKDEQAFLGLFLHAGVTWQSALSDARFERARAEDQSATRAAYQPDHTPAQFIRGIVSSDARIEETFEDVQIDTDGVVASVAFDFTFRRDEEIINRGREYWLLVRTDAGWKIASVVWSKN